MFSFFYSPRREILVLTASASLPLFLLAGCRSTGSTDSTDLDGPVFHKGNETRFIVGHDGPVVRLDDLTRIAKTIRKYKTLGADDQAIIRRVASLKFDGLVAARMQILAPQFELKKTQIRQQTITKIATVKKLAASRRQPIRETEQAVRQARSEETTQIAQVDLDWKSAARTEIVRQYGTDFAIPVRNPEGKAVVAFASIKESGVSVSAASYQLDGTQGELLAAAKSPQKMTHEGRSYALLDTPAKVE